MYDRLARLARNSGIDDDPVVQRLLRVAAHTDNEQLLDQIRRVVEYKAAQHQQRPFTEEDTPDSGFEIGISLSGEPVRLEPDTLTKHLLAVGQSGAGKTTFISQMLCEAFRLGYPFWVLDQKQDYRRLAVSEELLILPWNQMRLNPLEPPPGVPRRRWAQVLTDVLGHSQSLLSGSKNYLLTRLLRLYEATPETTPTLGELISTMEEDSINPASRTGNYRDVVTNRLAAMTASSNGLFHCRSGYPLDALIHVPTVFELDGLGRDTQNFIMELLVAWLYEYRLAQDHRGRGLLHLLVVDEAKQLFSAYKERQDAAGLPEIDDLTAKLREFGEGIIAADQEATKLTDSLKANTYTKILFSVGDDTQLDAVAESMQLTRRQRQATRRLAPGQAVFQQGSHDPLLVAVNDPELGSFVSDREVVDRMKPAWTKLQNQVILPDGETPDTDRSADDVGGDISETGETRFELSQNEVTLLEDIVQRPFVGVTDRYERFSSYNVGNTTKNLLLENGLIEERVVSQHPGRLKLLALTDAGRKVLATRGHEIDQVGRGGVVHRFWQHRICESYEDAGFEAAVESENADVAVQKEDETIAVEVAMENAPREIEHVAERLESGFDQVVVCCKSESVRDGLRERTDEIDVDPDSVRFLLFRDILNDQFPEEA